MHRIVVLMALLVTANLSWAQTADSLLRDLQTHHGSVATLQRIVQKNMRPTGIPE